MNKQIKRFFAVLLALLCVASLTVFSAGADEKTKTSDTADKSKTEEVKCATLTEAANFIFDGGSGEIAVVPARLTNGKETEDIYIASAMGMCFVKGKSNNLFASIMGAMNIKTKYYKLLKKTVLDNVPENSKLYLLGHSLGGIVMQMLMCDKDITSAYEIIGSVTVGSPYVMTKKSKREGSLTRFADVSDTVPKLGPAFLFSRKNYKNVICEDGGYDGNSDHAHNRSYRMAEVWNQYDALGVKDGSSFFTYIPSEVIGVAS